MKKKDLEKYVLTFIFVLTFIILIFTTKALAFNEINIARNIESSFEVATISYFIDGSASEMSLEELKSEINYCKDIKKSAHELAEYARELGWPESCDAIVNAKKEHKNALIAENFYQIVYENKLIEYENQKWEEKMKEYPEATFIWSNLKESGWNDYICAGIIGNIMTEVGGNTLSLNPSAGTTYYGICQWNKNHKKVQGVSLEEQCNYLKNTIKNELDTFGSIYKKDFDFNSFLKLTDTKQAALAFAKCYERCSSNTYGTRQNNAVKAYEYFVE